MTTFSPNRNENSAQSSVILSWLSELEKNKGDRAQLRRAADQLSILLVPAVHRLAVSLRNMGVEVNLNRLSLVAAVLASVNNDLNESLGKTFARVLGKSGSKSDGGEHSFRRLISADAEDFERCLQTWRRLIKLCDGRVSVPELATALYWMNDRAKKDLAIKFYENFNQ